MMNKTLKQTILKIKQVFKKKLKKFPTNGQFNNRNSSHISEDEDYFLRIQQQQLYSSKQRKQMNLNNFTIISTRNIKIHYAGYLLSGNCSNLIDYK